jgi:hypothetical protein
MRVRVGVGRHFGQDPITKNHKRIDRSGYAVLRGHQERAGNTVKELLMHYTSITVL